VTQRRPPAGDRLHVATLNIRNIADRWEERLPLLLADMRALQPDLMGLQEVVYPMQQDRLIGAASDGRYRAHRAFAGRPEYGNSVLVREPLEASEVERLDLGLNRSALRALVRLPEGASVLFVDTHLHHVPEEPERRDEQAAGLIDWLATAPRADAQIVVGDFNAEPDEPAAARMRDAGFRSSMVEANGADPPVTWPSGIQAPGMDTDGDPGCLDYIWLRGSVRATAARLVFDRPAAGDPTLYPSDHFGLSAQLVVGEGG
jgi:endonuclease/exonuclease/phosphatase family metal-dependent hydrolase